MSTTFAAPPVTGIHVKGNRSVRLLCVDDDPHIQTSLEMRFSNYNVVFERAFYGMQGVVEAQKHPPDAIILDLSMPNGSGLYLLECLRRRHETAVIPVIVMTGMRDPAVETEALALGADAYMTKPVDFNDLLEMLRTFVNIQELA